MKCVNALLFACQISLVKPVFGAFEHVVFSQFFSAHLLIVTTEGAWALSERRELVSISAVSRQLNGNQGIIGRNFLLFFFWPTVSVMVLRHLLAISGPTGRLGN